MLTWGGRERKKKKGGKEKRKKKEKEGKKKKRKKKGCQPYAPAALRPLNVFWYSFLLAAV
jgi:hypothetical protein